MFKEFPKCLFLAGDVASEYVVVFDADQESDKRKAGFSMANEPQEKAKRTRKVKDDNSTPDH